MGVQPVAAQAESKGQSATGQSAAVEEEKGAAAEVVVKTQPVEERVIDDDDVESYDSNPALFSDDEDHK